MDEDRQMKIWSRVKGAPGGAVSNLQPMIAGAMGQAAVFGALMRQMPVGAQGQLRMLREAELTHARCLRGIGMLSGCGQLKVAVAPVKQERPETVLRRSYGNALRAMRDTVIGRETRNTGRCFSGWSDGKRNTAPSLLN